MWGQSDSDARVQVFVPSRPGNDTTPESPMLIEDLHRGVGRDSQEANIIDIFSHERMPWEINESHCTNDIENSRHSICDHHSQNNGLDSFSPCSIESESPALLSDNDDIKSEIIVEVPSEVTQEHDVSSSISDVATPSSLASSRASSISPRPDLEDPFQTKEPTFNTIDTHTLYRLTNKKPHSWSTRQKVYLCAIYRFYEAENSVIARLLTHIFKGELVNSEIREFRASQVHTQYNNLRYYGVEKAWVAVVSPPFLSSVFEDIKEEIEANASMLDIVLHARSRDRPDLIVRSPKLSPSKSSVVKSLKLKLRHFPQSQRINGMMLKSLLRESKKYTANAGMNQQQTTVTDSPCARFQRPSFAKARATNRSEIPPNDSPTSDVDGLNAIAVLDPQPSTYVPRLLFRCYDPNSAGTNTTTYFRAGGFPNTDRPIHAAPAPESDDFETRFENHIWYNTQGSSFISVTSSLIWVLQKALQKAKSNPSDVYIAVLDGAAIANANQAYYARSAISRIRRRGFLREMRYKGSCEWLVWGDISSAAIIHTIRLGDFLALATLGGPRMRSILRIDQLHLLAEKKVEKMKGDFLRAPLEMFNTEVAACLGRVARFFGVGIDSERVLLLVEQVCNGFALEIATTEQSEGDDCTDAFIEELVKGMSPPESVSQEAKEAAGRALHEGIRRARNGLQRERRRLTNQRHFAARL